MRIIANLNQTNSSRCRKKICNQIFWAFAQRDIFPADKKYIFISIMWHRYIQQLAKADSIFQPHRTNLISWTVFRAASVISLNLVEALLSHEAWQRPKFILTLSPREIWAQDAKKMSHMMAGTSRIFTAPESCFYFATFASTYKDQSRACVSQKATRQFTTFSPFGTTLGDNLCFLCRNKKKCIHSTVLELQKNH